jgi:cholesterol transport system auxiliary component
MVRPPALAAESELRIYLSATGLFSAVVAPGTRLSPSYALEGDLTALWAQPQAGVARARIGYVLIDLRQNSTLVLQDLAEGTAPLQGPGPAAAQAAQRAALGNAFARIAAQIGAAIHSPRERRPQGA